MGIARAASTPIHAHRGMTVHRLRHRNASQVRTLWWWGKTRRGWLSSEHEELEDRLRRHQALMLHRYTKAMKRRALWDREPAPFFPWKRGSTNWEREMSSSQSMNAKVEEPDSKSGRRETPEQVFHRDFESFKRAVDHAIARDPVGTLFGRRLRSPISTNNSSWTSWSWIFDPKEIKEPVAEEPEKRVSEKMNTPFDSPAPITSESQPTPSVAHTSSSSKTTTTVKSSRSIVFQDSSSTTTEYVYDPISGRKVMRESLTRPMDPQVSVSRISKELPAQKKATSPPQVAPKTLFDTMFGEHGVSIPVKTYKPHKVYGYGSEAQSTKVKKDVPKENFETSRKREYDDLRWRTLGNNIDSTNFNCEPWNNREANPFPSKQGEPHEPAERTIRTCEAPVEDAPLFSGTTYQDKQIEPKNDWLATEGFRARQGMTLASLKDTSSPTPAPSQTTEKLQPSIDRPSSRSTSMPVKKFDSRLQPAIDRVPSTSKSEPVNTPWKKYNDILARDQKKAQDQREDIDLLRPSDIRAASKTARVTKQEVEDKKLQDRRSLEKDYDALAQKKDEAITKPISAPNLATNNMTHVWKHIEKYPAGIIAKSVQRLGLTKPIKESVNLTNYTPRKDSMIAQSTAIVEPKSQADLQIQALGKDLKAVYEEERGKIDHEVEANVQASPHAPRFSEPTVKPGVVRDLAMEQHTQVFEPRYARIVDGAKKVRRELSNVQADLEEFSKTKLTSVSEDMTSSKRPEEQATSDTAKSNPTKVDSIDSSSQYVLLKLSRDGDWVLPSSYQSADQITGFNGMSLSKNIVSAISQLSNPTSFVQWFGELDRMGYVLSRHNTSSLLFHKPNTAQKVGQRLRNRIAAQEAASQPPQQAANVLDELPASVPAPGPAAPTAPTSTAIQQPAPIENFMPAEDPTAAKPRRKSKSGTRMTRQEPVFSGQQRLKPQTTNLPDPEHFQKQNPSTSTSFTRARQSYEQDEPQQGFFKRVRTFIRRIFLTGLAFGAGAYSIGVIAEALQGHAQIAAGESGGPMKRLVLEDRAARERQRNGSFSTESPR